MFERVIYFVVGLVALIGGFLMLTLIFNPSALDVQGSLPLLIAIFVVLAGFFLVLLGSSIMYDGIRD